MKINNPCVNYPCWCLVLLLSLSQAIALAAPSDIDMLDQYLQQSESAHSDLTSDVEKRIRWFDGVRRTELSLVYLHGFSASNREISPVTEQLADRLGANVFYSRLTGHGRSEQAMTDGNIDKWLADTREALEIASVIGEKVVIISTSTGGTLATWLLAQSGASATVANIMISPNFGIKDRFGEIVRWRWGLQLAKWLNGPHYSFEPQNELHARYWTERYPMEALVPVIKLVDRVLEMDKTTITVPQLIIYSEDDVVIDVARVKRVSKQLINAEVTQVAFSGSSDPAQHVLAGDAVAPESTAKMVQLIANYIERLDL
ncbi:MAG: alpha/beta hydrolase [Arenicella sp.]|nr:alpha/beta hydrolase [Arenicella sp.]